MNSNENAVTGSTAPEASAQNGMPESASNAPAVFASPEPPDIDPARLDSDAVRVVQRLKQNGHQAYLVGGCVRDLLVGRTPKDFDIATSATPNQVRDLFRNSRLIGRRFRLAHVYFKGGKILEVSTFRAIPTVVEEPQPSEAAEGEVRSEHTAEVAATDVEGVAEANKAAVMETAIPDAPGDSDVDEEAAAAVLALAAVEKEDAAVSTPSNGKDAVARDHFIEEDNTFGTEQEDARRRDFTVNGLFYDVEAGRVIDHVRGLRDLARREMRTIGDPEVRLREDPVRLLRAVRFACKLDFEFEPRTYAAMEGAVEDLPRCSAPRLLEETFRLIRGGVAAPALKLLRALDALKVLLKPVDLYLSKQDQEGVDEFFAFAQALDDLVLDGKPFDDSMLLAAVLLPISLDEPEPSQQSDGRPNVAQTIELLLAELVRNSRLPRRIAERCRMILLAQRTLAGQRRRRGGLMSFRKHPLFNESLQVFEVWSNATGEFVAELEQWRAGQAPTPSNDAPGPSGRRRRRRRRGGKGGNGAQVSGEGGGSPPPPPAAPQGQA